MPKKRLVLIDGYSSIFRAFYAIRGLTSSKGEPTNAVLGFHQILRKLLRELEPDHVGVALDVSSRTVRSERFPDYKANRSPMPDDLRSQIPHIRRMIEGFKIPILELANYEADDVLGTLSHRAADEGFEVILVSSDKDLMQLVSDRVSLWHTGREKLYDPALVAEDFGAPPERVIDVLALMGDASDNIPGVPGIGEKGAKNLIAEFGSFDALLERAEEVKRKSYREGLIEHRDLALLSQELVTIHTDLPIELDPAGLVAEEPDTEALRELFTELELFSLVDQLGKVAKTAMPAAEELQDPAAWQTFVGEIDGDLVLAEMGDDPLCGLAVGPAEGDAVAWADFRQPGMADTVRESLLSWLASDRRIVGHDLKAILRWTGRPETLSARLIDPMLLSYLTRATRRGHELEEIALEAQGNTLPERKESGWQGSTPPSLGTESLLLMASERLEAVRSLTRTMEPELQDASKILYETIEEPLMPVLAAMEARGIELDADFLHGLSSELGEEIDRLEQSIHVLAGHAFNIKSPKQLGVVLFEELGLPALKKTRKTKAYSTGADILEELASRGYEIAGSILQYRELTKLKSTYVDALPPMVAADGRIHTRFQQAVAATGRLSSIEPNLQNIPIRTETGRRIRKAFVAGPGKALLVADYSQIELRVLAHISEDEALIEAFQSGLDIHRATAARVFGASPDLVNDEQRRAAKTINFGIIYGMSAFGLAKNLGVSQKDAAEFIDAYFSRYPGVERYTLETIEQAEATGKVETLYGRIRHIPDLQSRNRNLRDAARRMAVNARIQGTAADLLKMAMIKVDRRLRDEFPDTDLLLTVHDELVLEVPEEKADLLIAIVRSDMEGVAELSVPLVVDASYGSSWYDAKS